jgi:sugar fermentation stimulation protein A
MVSFIKVEGKIVEGVFKERITRFSALVQVGDTTVPCFLPNPGRLSELLTRNVKVILRETAGGKRKTSYDLIGVHYKSQLVSVDSRVPNKLVLEALRNRDLEEFSEYSIIKPEHPYRRVKFDFFLSNGQKPCLLEIKSCTLVKDGVALFPDAKTERGTRHVRDLLKAKNEGYRTCILFIIQRTDAKVFSPNDEADPEFGKALRQAAKQGVEVYACYSEFFKDKITLKEKVKVTL